jgi:hypothetical protein
MEDTLAFPCSEWAGKLVSFHPADLSPSDREALTAHVASCHLCAAVLHEYRAIDEHLHQALSTEPPSNFSVQLLPDRDTLSAEWEDIDGKLTERWTAFELKGGKLI